MRLVLKVVMGSFLIAVSAPLVNTLGFYGLQDKSSSNPHRSNFRYVIVFNNYLHNGRLLFVLMDERAFSEANLRELFKLISKRFPEPDELHVAVFTSLEQIPTPEEMDYAAKSSPNSEEVLNLTNAKNYPFAYYDRAHGHEIFKYSTGSSNGTEKTVIIKGVDFMRRNNKKP